MNTQGHRKQQSTGELVALLVVLMNIGTCIAKDRTQAAIVIELLFEMSKVWPEKFFWHRE